MNIVILSGAGISAESGLPTFRDSDGLWRGHRPQALATPDAWARDPGLVLDFYTMRRKIVRAASPNAAHVALAELGQTFDVQIITQNVDDLHERAGSSKVLHLHGQIRQGRSAADPACVVELGNRDIVLGDVAPDGAALRPNVVWFGEAVPAIDAAAALVASADRLMIVGTSLSVYPAAGLHHHVPDHCETILVTQWADNPPADVEWIKRPAAQAVPDLVRRWIGG